MRLFSNKNLSWPTNLLVKKKVSQEAADLSVRRRPPASPSLRLRLHHLHPQAFPCSPILPGNFSKVVGNSSRISIDN